MITCEAELNYYYQKVSVWVTSKAAKQIKNYDLSKLANFKKIPEKLRFDGKYPAGHPKPKFSRFFVKIMAKKLPAVQHSIEKLILLNFEKRFSFLNRKNISQRERCFHFWLGPDLSILHFLEILVFSKTYLLFKLPFWATELQ